MTLETLFSHPAEYAKRHRESPEVQSFKQNPSRESMVAYIASQTLSHTEIVPEEEQSGSIWDALTQRSSTRQARQTATFWDAVEENVEDDEAKCPYEDDDQEEQIAPPTRRWPRPNILDEDEEEEPFNTPESSAEHALFITQQDPDPHHEPGTLSCTQKGKTPATRKRPSSTTNIWASFGLSAESSTSARNSAPAAREKPRQLIPEQPEQPAGKWRKAEEEEHEENEESLQAATRTLTSPESTMNYTTRKWFVKQVVLQDTLIHTTYFITLIHVPYNMTLKSRYHNTNQSCTTSY